MSYPLTKVDIEAFLHRLGGRLANQTTFYLIGGSALLLLGNQRATLDIDYVGTDYPLATDILAATVQAVATEMTIEVEPVPIGEFIPLPDGFEARHDLIGHFGQLSVYLFDPYSIAISKLDRGFGFDLQDVYFLIDKGFITFAQLEQYAEGVLKRASIFDLDKKAFLEHLEEVRKLL